jgi:hypothetical protein
MNYTENCYSCSELQHYVTVAGVYRLEIYISMLHNSASNRNEYQKL